MRNVFIKALVFCQVFLWHIHLAKKARSTDLKHFLRPQRPIWHITMPMKDVIGVLSLVYSWLPKENRCLVVSLVTISAFMAFAHDCQACDLVIAVKQFSFGAHSWVEVNRSPVPFIGVAPGYREIARLSFHTDRR